jgi:tetratricopeptide (TPR) repeat protein
MSPATRVRLIVVALAVATAGVVTGVVLATRQDPSQPTVQCKQAKPLIVPGVPSKHVEAVRNALALPVVAAARKLEAVERIAPRDPVVQFNYGIVLFCGGYLSEASQAFRAAKTMGRDTYYEMRADEILHPQYYQPPDGLYPLFQPLHSTPLIEQGLQLQRQGHQRSAERAYARAARLNPNDDEAQVAAAVGRFDEDDLSASFSHLGPLTKRFPRSQSVRYHLGLLLAWTGQHDQALVEFKRARALGPKTALGKQATVFLKGVGAGGTGGTSR